MPEKPKTFSQNDYEIKKRETLYDGNFRLMRYTLRHQTFAGNWSETFTREILERRPASAILPYDPQLDRIILIEQFRAGALANPQNPWLLEIVAGIIDGDEKPEAVAIRESKEEAGCEILDIYPICDYFVSPGGANEYVYLFCGRVDASNAGGLFGLLEEEHEDIRSFTVDLDEAQKMLQEGQIKTAPAIMAIQWLLLNRDWLKQLWLTK